MQDAQLHVLPCKIDHVGAAPVSKYFAAKRTERGLEACFRGMPLHGSLLSVPSHRSVALLDSAFRLGGRADSVVLWSIEGEDEARSTGAVKPCVLSALWDDILQ